MYCPNFIFIISSFKHSNLTFLYITLPIHLLAFWHIVILSYQYFSIGNVSIIIIIFYKCQNIKITVSINHEFWIMLNLDIIYCLPFDSISSESLWNTALLPSHYPEHNLGLWNMTQLSLEKSNGFWNKSRQFT